MDMNNPPKSLEEALAQYQGATKVDDLPYCDENEPDNEENTDKK